MLEAKLKVIIGDLIFQLAGLQVELDRAKQELDQVKQDLAALRKEQMQQEADADV